MTVGELKKLLEHYSDALPICVMHHGLEYPIEPEGITSNVVPIDSVIDNMNFQQGDVYLVIE